MSPTILVGGSRGTHRWRLYMDECGSYWMRTSNRESLKAKEFVLGDDFRAGQVSEEVRLLVDVGDERKIFRQLVGFVVRGMKR